MGVCVCVCVGVFSWNELLLKLFYGKNIECSHFYTSHSDKASWYSIVIRGRICHIYCTSRAFCFRSSRSFISSFLLSGVWMISYLLKENKFLIKREFSFYSFIHFLRKSWCRMYHSFPFIFDTFISCLINQKATLSKPDIEDLFTTAQPFCWVSTSRKNRRHDSRTSFKKIISPFW